MKTLMISMVAAVALAIVSFADLPATVYVVPEGTVGNTPTAPYDTWATAANDIKTAAEAVATHGVVKVLSGTYPSSAGFMTTRAYEIQVFASADGGGEAGSVTLSNNYFFNDPVATEDPDNHSVLVSKGTLTTSETSAFVDRGSTTKGVASNYKLVFSGNSAVFSKSGGYLYSGYDMVGTSLAFVDGAKGSCARIYIGQHTNAKESTLTVANGAAVSLTGVCQCGAEATDCGMMISNATISAQNYVFGKSGAEKGVKVVFAGEAPRLESKSSAVFNGDASVSFDVAEMPVDGYKEYVLYNTDITFEETAVINVIGVESLRARLRQAGVTNLTANLGISYAGGAHMTLPASIVEATNERLAGTGFTLVVSGAYIKLLFVEPGGFQTPVFVDAASVTAKPPYASWASAAVTFSDISLFLAKGGAVNIASGDYRANYATPEFAATYRAYRTAADDSAGSATLGATIFSGLAGTNADPQRHLLTLAYGTFTVPDGANVFLDSSSAGYAQNSSNRLVVTGADTVFNDKSHNLYVGYAAKNTQLLVKDHATCMASTVYSGRSANGSGSTIVVEDGGLLDIANQLSMGRQSADARLVIDNAMVLCKTFDCGADGTTLNERICIKGLRPYFCPQNAVAIGGNATLEFDVSELPLGKVDDNLARISTKDFAMTDATSLRIVGVDQLKARLESDESSPRKVKYEIIYAWGNFDLSDEKLNEARTAAKLPDGWTLEKESRYLCLTIKKNLGFSVIIR